MFGTLALVLTLSAASPALVIVAEAPMGLKKAEYGALLERIEGELTAMGVESKRVAGSTNFSKAKLKQLAALPRLTISAFRVGSRTSLALSLLLPRGKELAAAQSIVSDDAGPLLPPEIAAGLLELFPRTTEEPSPLEAKSRKAEPTPPDPTRAVLAPTDGDPAQADSYARGVHGSAERSDSSRAEKVGEEVEEFEEAAAGGDALVPASESTSIVLPTSLAIGGSAVVALGLLTVVSGVTVAYLQSAVLDDPNGTGKAQARAIGLLGLAVGVGGGVGVFLGGATAASGLVLYFATE